MANKARNTPGHHAGNVTFEEVKDDGRHGLRNVQSGFEKYQKAIIGIATVIVLAVAGYFLYKNFVQKPNDEKAANAIFRVQQWFEADSMNLVLNGDGQNQGALSLMKKFDGTKTGNLAYYYAGIASLKTGKAQDAIKYLEKFDGKGIVFQYIAYGSMGSAYLDLNQTDKAIEFYKKAASGNSEDNFTNPYYLRMAGFAAEQSGKTDEAIKFYKEIKEKYPQSTEARDIDRFLSRLGVITLD